MALRIIESPGRKSVHYWTNQLNCCLWETDERSEFGCRLYTSSSRLPRVFWRCADSRPELHPMGFRDASSLVRDSLGEGGEMRRAPHTGRGPQRWLLVRVAKPTKDIATRSVAVTVLVETADRFRQWQTCSFLRGPTVCTHLLSSHFGD